MKLRDLSRGLKTAYHGSNVARRVQRFDGGTDGAFSENAAHGENNHAETVREYYDLCNEFMVFGWGESLHFAPLKPGESLSEAKIRHQRSMIAKLELQEGMTVVDVGCGIGGPMRRVAREAVVRVVGVNTSKIQLQRARSLNADAGLDHLVDCIESDFMDMSVFDDHTFDRAYAIESTCHAPDKAGAFAEIFRVLKPGALFWGQEMCMTDKFDPNDGGHAAIKQELIRGVALRDIATMDEVDRALESVGFHVIENADLGITEGPSTPWYRPLEYRDGSLGRTLRTIPLGRKVHIGIVKVGEVLNVFPKSSSEVVRFMDRTAGAYVAGGRTGTFTPLYCFLARKPA